MAGRRTALTSDVNAMAGSLLRPAGLTEWADVATERLFGRHSREDAAECYRAAPSIAEETNMAKTALGMSKRTLVQALSASAALFGVTGVLAPRALGSTYGVPPSPHTTQLLRLFGSRMLALAAWTFTAQTKEETDRVLAVATGMNLVDTLTALTAARDIGGVTALRAAATSATFAALGLAVRSLED